MTSAPAPTLLLPSGKNLEGDFDSQLPSDHGARGDPGPPETNAGRAERAEHELGLAQGALARAQEKIDLLTASEIELRAAHQSARAILNQAPPLLTLDQELRVVMANRSFYFHFGAAPAQTEKRLIYELFDGQWNIPKLRVLLEEVLPRNSFFDDFEITQNLPGLGLRTILLSARRVDPINQVILNLEDVTERLHFQAAMRRSEIRYRRLFEAAKDGILVVDPETRRITDCNPFIMELLGYTRNEMLGKELWQIGLLKDERASREAFGELQANGYIRYEDLSLETKTGLRREVEFVSNLYHENGLQVIQCNVREISACKRGEQALEAANRQISHRATELEERVADRTARLRETIGELEKFSYSVAHDMRAPLRAMSGFAEILMEDYGTNLPPEARAYVGYITAAAARMDLMIQDVLTYTTMLQNDIGLSEVDLDSLTRQVLQTYPQLKSTHAQIEIEGMLPKVRGHAAAISQCLSNVLTNAVKFVAAGTRPKVRIRAVVNDRFVRVWVEDNGIGILPKDHQRIFEMFERVSNDYEGTGIGLAIVRKSVERLRGDVGVESELGKGSRFWIDFTRIS